MHKISDQIIEMKGWGYSNRPYIFNCGIENNEGHIEATLYSYLVGFNTVPFIVQNKQFESYVEESNFTLIVNSEQTLKL